MRKVIWTQSHRYEDDVVTIRAGEIVVQATGNHPFFVACGRERDTGDLLLSVAEVYGMDLRQISSKALDRRLW